MAAGNGFQVTRMEAAHETGRSNQVAHHPSSYVRRVHHSPASAERRCSDTSPDRPTPSSSSQAHLELSRMIEGRVALDHPAHIDSDGQGLAENLARRGSRLEYVGWDLCDFAALAIRDVIRDVLAV